MSIRPHAALALPALLGAAAIAGGALADTPADAAPVATAAGAPAVPATPAPSTEIRAADPADAGPDLADEDAPPDRKLHGYVEVGVGNRGYREVSGAITAPLGQTGQATIVIGSGQGR